MAAKRKASPKLQITYVRSSIGYTQRQKDTLRALGIRRIGQTVLRPDTQAIRGMVEKVKHLVSVEEIVG